MDIYTLGGIVKIKNVSRQKKTKRAKKLQNKRNENNDLKSYKLNDEEITDLLPLSSLIKRTSNIDTNRKDVQSPTKI